MLLHKHLRNTQRGEVPLQSTKSAPKIYDVWKRSSKISEIFQLDNKQPSAQISTRPLWVQNNYIKTQAKGNQINRLRNCKRNSPDHNTLLIKWV